MRYKNFTKGVVLFLILSLLLCACSKPENPSKGDQTKTDYSYSLSEEQAQNYQSAVCYLLKRDGENVYRVQYSNCGVTFSDGKLNTNYDGMAVEISVPTGEHCYPVMDLNGSDNSKGYIGTVVLTDKQDNMAGWRYLLKIGEENKPELTAIRLREEGTDEDLLSGKYNDLPDFESYIGAFITDGTYYQPTYDDSKNPLPISQWTANDAFTGYDIDLANKVEMNYVPLVGGDYYLLYEITDTQGNTYCSDFIPYKTEPAPVESKSEPDVAVKWTKGERQQLLLENNGVEVYLSVEKDVLGNSTYALKVKNSTHNAVSCRTENGLVNGIVPCTTGLSLTVEPGKFVADSIGFSFGVSDGSDELEKIESLQFDIYAKDSVTGKYIIENQTIMVDMSEAWPATKEYSDYFNLVEPAMDAMAKEQILVENDFIRLTLIAAGHLDSTWSNDLTMTFKLENLSQHSQTVSIKGAAVNDFFETMFCNEILPAGCITYMYGSISEYGIKDYVGNSIETLTLLIETQGQEDWIWRSVEQQWVPVTLEKSGKAIPFDAGTTLWESAGVKIGNRGYNEISNSWMLTLTNDSEKDVSLVVVDTATGEELDIKAKAGANQKACFEVSAPSTNSSDQFSIRIKIYDFNGETLLAEGTEDITLPKK